MSPQRREGERERYRQAAQDALDQLSWCVGYLYGLRKTALAAALGRERAAIRRRLLGQPGEPTPERAGSGSRVDLQSSASPRW